MEEKKCICAMLLTTMNPMLAGIPAHQIHKKCRMWREDEEHPEEGACILEIAAETVAQLPVMIQNSVAQYADMIQGNETELEEELEEENPEPIKQQDEQKPKEPKETTLQTTNPEQKKE